MSNKITTMQITTAEQILNNKLNEKRNTLAKALFFKDIKPYLNDVKNINKELKKAVDKVKKLTKKVAKNDRLEINDAFEELMGTIPEKEEDVEFSNNYHNNDILKPAEYSSYSEKSNSYYIPLEKEQKEVNNFILKLKLGTVLMEDIEGLLERLETIK